MTYEIKLVIQGHALNEREAENQISKIINKKEMAKNMTINFENISVKSNLDWFEEVKEEKKFSNLFCPECGCHDIESRGKSKVQDVSIYTCIICGLRFAINV